MVGGEVRWLTQTQQHNPGYKSGPLVIWPLFCSGRKIGSEASTSWCFDEKTGMSWAKYSTVDRWAWVDGCVHEHVRIRRVCSVCVCWLTTNDSGTNVRRSRAPTSATSSRLPLRRPHKGVEGKERYWMGSGRWMSFTVNVLFCPVAVMENRISAHLHVSRCSVYRGNQVTAKMQS